MARVAWRDRVRGERGSQLIEFSLVLPLLLLVMLGIVDFGFLFQRYEVLTNAAREGARVAVLPGYGAGDVTARVNQFLTAGGLTATPGITPLAPQAVNVGGVCMTLAGVTVTYPHAFNFVGQLITYFGEPALGSRNLTATARMRYEGPALACP
jgi:Flp pilus assembly protein TadG